ncbi:Cerato-platanin [Microdochium nivale]|nr:Cerato-platanin [Microdochium nivale]
MRSSALFTGLFAAAATIFTVSAQTGSSGTVWATPHDSFSSSVGVLGCKIDTNRVAYWPGSIDCNNICISLSHEGRTVRLLRIDQSQGAFDVSYDAWNYLVTGYGAAEKPTAGGAIAMTFESLPPSECADLIHTEGSKLPLSASNSMNFLASCLAQPNSWVAKNFILYNILDSVCSWGFDEKCTLDWPTANQAQCKNALGQPVTLTSAPVYNIKYPSGQTVNAATNTVVDTQPYNYAIKPIASLAASLAPSIIGLSITLSYIMQDLF